MHYYKVTFVLKLGFKSGNIRWKQRFSDFERSYLNLKNALEIKEIDEVYRAGIIKFFEFTFELSWKTMKDLLKYDGLDVKNPRQTIQQAFQSEVITNGHEWIDLLEKRNVFVHT